MKATPHGRGLLRRHSDLSILQTTSHPPTPYTGTQSSSALFTSNTVVLYWTVCWWIVNHNPIPLLDDVMAQPAVGIAARACLHTLRALTIAATTNAAAVAYKGVVAPAIIAGTLAGCGGKLLSDSLDSVSGGKGRFELKNPGFLLRSSVVNSSLVYVLVHYLKAFSVVEATGLLLAISLAYTLSDDLAGSVVDASTHITNVFCTVIAPKELIGARPVARAVAATTGTPTKRSASKKRSKTPSRR